MATADLLLSVAGKELGVKEDPMYSNKVKYNNWYYGRTVSGQDYPWCMVFVQWVFSQAGVQLPLLTASCGALMNAAKRAEQWVSGDYRRGDVVIYSFVPEDIPQHCGIVESVSGSSVTCIEGNTSIAGSQSNGGQVLRRTRNKGYVLGAVRPEFREEKTMDNKASPAHEEGVAWAVEKGILRGNGQGDLMLRQPLTREQFCTMLYRYDQSRKK